MPQVGGTDVDHSREVACLRDVKQSLQTGHAGFDIRQVLAFDIPMPAPAVEARDAKLVNFYDEAVRRIGQLPGVDAVAAGNFVPWRDAGETGPRITTRFTADGYTPANGEDPPIARLRFVSPALFSVLGARLVAGREFTEADRRGGELVAIISQTVAQRFFSNGEALNRHLLSTDPKPVARRIVGVVADVDDENLVGQPALRLALPSPLCWLTTRPGTVSSTSPARITGRASTWAPVTAPWLAAAAMPTRLALGSATSATFRKVLVAVTMTSALSERVRATSA